MEVSKRTIKRFGKRVKFFREEKGWTQEALADELQVDRSYISSLERGLRNPTLKTATRLAVIFRLTLSELFDNV